MKRVVKLYNLKFQLHIIKGADDSYADNIIKALINNNYIKSGDKVTIGKKGIRINHTPIKFENGEVLEVESFQKPYSYQPVVERKKQSQPYRIEGDVAIFKTRQKVPVEFIVDKEDIEKVKEHIWAFHRYKNGEFYIVYRYKTVNNKWQTITLSEHLGFGKAYTHKNGNILDFRKSNMRYKKPVYDAIGRKLNKNSN